MVQDGEQQKEHVKTELFSLIWVTKYVLIFIPLTPGGGRFVIGLYSSWVFINLISEDIKEDSSLGFLGWEL